MSLDTAFVLLTRSSAESRRGLPDAQRRFEFFIGHVGKLLPLGGEAGTLVSDWSKTQFQPNAACKYFSLLGFLGNYFGARPPMNEVKRKLIEVALSLQAINKVSAREKSVPYSHPSTLDWWWARRPFAAVRAAIFAQIVDNPSSLPDLFPTGRVRARPRGYEVGRW